MPARIDFDWKLFDSILQFAPSEVVVVDIMGCSKDTIERRLKEKHNTTFKVYREKMMAKTKLRLQQKAISMALEGNKTMLIFCLKNLCQWADKVEHSVDERKPLVLKYALDDKK